MDLDQAPFHQTTLHQSPSQVNSPEIASQFNFAGEVGLNKGQIANEALAEELKVALPDINHFRNRLSNVIGSDAVSSLERNLPELLGYSRECADCLAENGLLGSIPRGGAMQ